MAQSDAHFKSELEKSQPTVDMVGKWLEGRGHDITINEMKYRSSYSQRMECGDNGDITLHKRVGDKTVDLRVEIKRRSIVFTGVHDFLFDTLIVDEVYKVDRVDMNQVAAYFSVNKAGTHIAYIDPQTKDKWVVETRFDSQRNRNATFYGCPKELVAFAKL